MKDKEAATAIVNDMTSNGGQAIAIAADVGKESEVKKMFQIIDDQLVTVTALVNNAGILETQCRVDERHAFCRDLELL